MILLVEPDAVLARIYSGALAATGHGIVWVTQAQQAIHEIDKEHPDLIILEPQLISHSGIEFLYELRSYSDLQKIPVLLHTFIHVDSFQQSRDALQTLGIIGYLYKPQTSLQQLVTLIQTIPQMASK